jgi:hypothetical protein
MARLTASAALVAFAALLGLFFPSSIGGVISFDLGRVAMVLNALVLGVMLLRDGPIDRLQFGVTLAIPLWLAIVTVLSPQAEFSPGALFIFIGLALLFAIRLDHIRWPNGRWLMLGINVCFVALGVGQSLYVAPVIAFTKEFYSAFYPNLMVSMLDWLHKPVLTFATHSTAGFFYYLFFWLNFRAFRATGSLLWLGWTLAMLALGLNTRSTTSTVLMMVAIVQLMAELGRRVPSSLRAPAFTTSSIVLAIVAILAGAPEKLAALARLIEGTQTAGLRSRYSTTGMLGGNLRYLSEEPFSPIGFTYGPEDLFYGDSGFVLMLVRGSLPLLILVYFGFWRFLSRNLHDRGDVLCLYLVTCAFEIGYTPLQLYRFTLFLPFMIVFLNALVPAAAPSRPAPVGPARRLADPMAGEGAVT